MGNINRVTFRRPVPTRLILWTKMLASQLIPPLYTIITPAMRGKECSRSIQKLDTQTSLLVLPALVGLNFSPTPQIGMDTDAS